LWLLAAVSFDLLIPETDYINLYYFDNEQCPNKLFTSTDLVGDLSDEIKRNMPDLVNDEIAFGTSDPNIIKLLNLYRVIQDDSGNWG